MTRLASVQTESERRRQRRQPRGGQRAQRYQRRFAVEPLAAGGQLGPAAGQMLRQQADHRPQRLPDQAHAAAQPAHGAGQGDVVAAHLVGGLHQTRRLLGVHDHRFQFPERPGQPRRQAVGQQAEGGVALRAVPAGDQHAGRPLAQVGAVRANEQLPGRG